ncbi:hypothetical protein [Streptomyces sp. Ag109_O5-10]|nr:hypothetical protein [Streptomyces sp. Ag109_O5-10]
MGREPSFHAAQLPLPTEPFRLEPTGLTAVGEDARTWLEIARVFL